MPGAEVTERPQQDRTRNEGGARLPEPEVRRFPYPYFAMAAICSDLDETPDASTYYDIARFLNTTESTRSGKGMGLEVGNTIYFDMPPSQFAYWNTDDAGRSMVRTLIKTGHIDCIHSFGDLATTRSHAARALDELSSHGCMMNVWVDHAQAKSNFGSDIMLGEGDLASSKSYHADLSCDYGIRYVWRGRVTSVIGQDGPRHYRGLFRGERAASSIKTLGKEWVKGRLARLGVAKYAMHGPNLLVRPVALRDGRSILEFIRFSACCEGVERMDDAAGFGEWLNEAVLERLVEQRGMSILYTHLGKIRDVTCPIPSNTRKALERMARMRDQGRLLVATTRRLLGYRTMRESLEGHIRWCNDGLRIFENGLPSLLEQGDLDGLTVYVPEPVAPNVFVNGRELANVTLNPPDETGRQSVSIPWKNLSFPDISL